VIAVDKVCAGQHAMGICIHFAPPAFSAFGASPDFVSALVP